MGWYHECDYIIPLLLSDEAITGPTLISLDREALGEVDRQPNLINTLECCLGTIEDNTN